MGYGIVSSDKGFEILMRGILNGRMEEMLSGCHGFYRDLHAYVLVYSAVCGIHPADYIQIHI